MTLPPQRGGSSGPGGSNLLPPTPLPPSPIETSRAFLGVPWALKRGSHRAGSCVRRQVGKRQLRTLGCLYGGGGEKAHGNCLPGSMQSCMHRGSRVCGLSVMQDICTYVRVGKRGRKDTDLSPGVAPGGGTGPGVHSQLFFFFLYLLVSRVLFKN